MASAQFAQASLDSFVSIQIESGKKSQTSKISAIVGRLLLPLFLLTLLSYNPLFKYRQKIKSLFWGEPAPATTVLEVERISPLQKQQLDEAIKISFVGDLILLRPAVHRGYNPQDASYDFSSMFEFTEEYFHKDDLTIGVFEGPCAGEAHQYSTSSYDDGIHLVLNFPDEYVRDVKKAGFDLVTTSNNHIYDCGIEGALRTVDVLQKEGLDYVGTHLSKQQREKIKVVTVKGKRIAILAYTYGSNYISEEDLLNGVYAQHVSILCSPQSANYDRVREQVAADFAKAKELQPDIILVLPHMGEQFLLAPDDYQLAWCDYFTELGADIILSDHPHSPQPVEWRKGADGRDVVIVHCPGNYVNSYILGNGDACALTEVYLNPQTGKPFAAGVIPMRGIAMGEENWTAIAIRSIFKKNFRFTFSDYDMMRFDEIHRLITKVMLGIEMPLHEAAERYYLWADRKNRVYRDDCKAMEITSELRNTPLYQLLEQSSHVCFVGDSITEGTLNGGFGWHESLCSSLKDTQISTFAKGSKTSKYISTHKEKIAAFAADTYVIAIGTNDIRYRNPSVCAMSPEDYISELKSVTDEIHRINHEARIVFISPWIGDEYDPNCAPPKPEREKLYEQFDEALNRFCQEKGYMHINPNIMLKENLQYLHKSTWLVDHIHPNAVCGIELYARLVLLASKASTKS